MANLNLARISRGRRTDAADIHRVRKQTGSVHEQVERLLEANAELRARLKEMDTRIDGLHARIDARRKKVE